MSFILENTNIPAKCNNYFSVITGLGTGSNDGYKMYNIEETKGWLTGSNTAGGLGGGLDNITNTAIASMVDFIKNRETNSELLINRSNLQLLDFPVEPLQDILKSALVGNSRGKITSTEIKDVCFLASYINSQGLIHGSDMLRVMMEKKTAEEAEKGRILKVSLNALTEATDCSTFEDLVEDMNAQDLYELCLEASAASSSKDPSVEYAHNITTEELKDRLVETVKEPVINLTNIATEVFVQDVERRFYVNAFLKASNDWTVLEPDDVSISRITQLVNYNNVHIGGNRMATVLEEFYFLALPYRFRLKDQNSTPSIDGLQQVLFGAEAGQIKALYEIVTFSDVRNVKETSILLGILDKVEATLKEHTNLCSESVWKLPDLKSGYKLLNHMIKHWGRIQCFVTFLEMCRVLVPELQEIVVGAADDCVVAGDRIDTGGIRNIPENVIYYIQGWYYARVNKNTGILSKCYKTLIYNLYSNQVADVARKNAGSVYGK